MPNEVVWTGVGGIVTGLVTVTVWAIRKIWLTKSNIDRRRQKDDEESERRATVDRRNELWDYINRLNTDLETEREERRRDREELERKIEKEREEREACEDRHLEAVRFRTQAETWIRTVTGILHARNIKVPPYDPVGGDPGSGAHRPLGSGAFPVPPGPPKPHNEEQT